MKAAAHRSARRYTGDLELFGALAVVVVVTAFAVAVTLALRLPWARRMPRASESASAPVGERSSDDHVQAEGG